MQTRRTGLVRIMADLSGNERVFVIGALCFALLYCVVYMAVRDALAKFFPRQDAHKRRTNPVRTPLAPCPKCRCMNPVDARVCTECGFDIAEHERRELEAAVEETRLRRK